MTLRELFRKFPNRWLSAESVAGEICTTKRELRDSVNKLNNELAAEGSCYLICSSTAKGESGYRYTCDPEITRRYLNQISAHAKSELRKRRPAKIILKRQIETKLKRMPPPIIEESGQVRLL